MRVISVSELKKCLNGCKWTCGKAVIVGVKSASELALELKKAAGGEVYVKDHDIHIITKKCYIVLAVWWTDGGVVVGESLWWSAK